jgi:hypothetical protein
MLVAHNVCLRLRDLCVFVVNFAVLRSVRRCHMGADVDLDDVPRQWSIHLIALCATEQRGTCGLKGPIHGGSRFFGGQGVFGRPPSGSHAKCVSKGGGTRFGTGPTGRFESGPFAFVSVLRRRFGSVAQQLRPVLEVHGVEMRPPAAPDEAVPFENRHDLRRDAVTVGRGPGGVPAPQPVV